MLSETRPGGIAAPAMRTAGDRAFADLVRGHFDDLVRRDPILATYLGLHDHDALLPDLSREAKLDAIAAERRHVGALEALDPATLSAENAFELELALFSARRRVFDGEVHRLWERRAHASEEIGDALFLLLARPFAPLTDRLEAITARLEAAPLALQQVRDRLSPRPVRLWLELELDSLPSLPAFLDEIVAAAAEAWPADAAPRRRLARAAERARAALVDYGSWLRSRLPDAVDDFALGRDDLETLIGLRALDGLDGDRILAIGEEQLAREHAVRGAAARDIEPGLSEAAAVARVKADHPADFETALEAYRAVMRRARAFVADRGLATLPATEMLEVVATPGYLRRVMPFAAYFAPAAFDLPRRGTYIVTPSVDGDEGAMREHNFASISNTSIHEAYPGHHLQLTAALERATLSRLLVDAPEFVEGWAMYCELLMREHGFDATPQHRVAQATDAIWRACRIILDIRLHRGEIGVEQAVDYLVEQTGFERPHAAAEVARYTSTPTYQFSYLLGRELILRLREDEQRRLGSAFSLRRFHDALLWSGSLPVSFHRRLLAGEGGGPVLPDDGWANLPGSALPSLAGSSGPSLDEDAARGASGGIGGSAPGA